MARPAAPTPATLGFGPFLFDPERKTLRHGTVPLRIGGRALEILAALVARPGVLMSKRELIACVWPNTVVEDCNLKVNMAALRKALGDEPGTARYIATVTGRGYRFVAPVRTMERPGAAPPVQTSATRRHNLPFSTSRIFGRADVIGAIRRDLEVSRLVSIVGPGGIGKTTVARAVAEQALESHRDGVWLVDMGSLTEAALVPKAIAAAMALPAEAADSVVTLCQALRDREILLVVDGCEHLIEAVAACTDLILSQAAGVKALVTSREPLQLSGERIRRLPGLGTPPISARLTAQEALTFPAVQLFVDRAIERLESFMLRDADAAAVAEICRRLDGLALAIEFAATRVDAFGVDGLLQQLDDLLGFLAGGHVQGPQRQRTLAATLDWSYGLLPAEEAALLRNVSVFAGGFDIDGACAIAALSPVETANALSELVAKSLLAVDVEGAGVAYRLLGTTRRYGLEKLRASGQEQGVRRRYAEHVCMALEQATAQRVQHGAAAQTDRDGRILDDLRGALEWTARDPAFASMHLRLIAAGLPLWQQPSQREECRAHVLRAIEMLGAVALAGSASGIELKAWLASAAAPTPALASPGVGADVNASGEPRSRTAQSLLQAIGLH